MKLNEPLIAEIRHELTATRRMLEHLPEDSLDWRPHSKSRTLGEIAAHIANLPGVFLATIDADEFDRNEYTFFVEGKSDILDIFDKNTAKGLTALEGQSDASLMGNWRYRVGETTIFEMPRIAVIKAMCLNHLIHHRGQLSVYLRLLDIPFPGMYGPTADEAVPVEG